MPDELIAGPVVAEGEFTLDRARAQEKMRRYSLPNPHAYILELVKAAVLQGAGAIGFTLDTDDMRLRFDGPPFSRDELEAAELAALTGTGAVAHLGMGLAAAMALEPRFVRCESGGVRLELRPRRPDRLEAAPAGGGTALHVRDRARPGQILEFFRSLAGWTTEGEILRSACRFCPVPVQLNGRLITEDWRQFPQLGRVPIGDAGVGGFTAGQRSELRIVKDGVLMETVALDLGPLPFQALIHGQGLAENVSHNGLVRDAAFAAVLAQAREARPAAVACLAREVRGRLDEFGWLLGPLREEVLTFQTAAEVPPDLAALRLWETATGDLVRLSLEEILAWIEAHGDIPYAYEARPGLRLDGMPRVLLESPSYPFHRLKDLLGHRSRNITRRIRNLEKRETNRALWKRRRTEPTLEAYRFYHRLPLDAPGLRGEIGVGVAMRPPLIRFVVDGCALGEFRPDLPLAGLEAVVCGDFTPSENFDNVRRDELWARALLEVARRLPELYARVSVRPGLLRGPVEILGNAEFPVSLLRACGVPQARAAALATPAPLPDDHPLAQVACFGDGEGSLIPLAELRRRGVAPGAPDPAPTRELAPAEREPDPEPEPAPVAEALERFLEALFRRHPSLPRPEVRLQDGEGEATVRYVAGEFRLRRADPLVAAGGEDPALLGFLASLCLSALRLPWPEERALLEGLVDLTLAGGVREVTHRVDGSLEEIRSDGLVRGWASDPQEPGRPLQVNLVLDYRILAGTATASPDFRFQLAPEHMNGGTRVLSAVVEGQELAGSPGSFTTACPWKAEPIGKLEAIDADGVATGWTLDPNAPHTHLGVHFYLDGPAGQGEFIGGVGTGMPRPDVNRSTGYSGDPGFRFAIPPEHLDGSDHELYAYGLDTEGGPNPLLQGCPYRFCR